MTNSKTTKLSPFALTTLGTWTHGAARMVAEYFDETSIRLSTGGQVRVMTENEWLEMWDNLRDAGYTRAA